MSFGIFFFSLWLDYCGYSRHCVRSAIYLSNNVEMGLPSNISRIIPYKDHSSYMEATYPRKRK